MQDREQKKKMNSPATAAYAMILGLILALVILCSPVFPFSRLYLPQNLDQTKIGEIYYFEEDSGGFRATSPCTFKIVSGNVFEIAHKLQKKYPDCDIEINKNFITIEPNAQISSLMRNRLAK